MRTSSIAHYALRTFGGQTSQSWTSFTSASPDRVVTRSATMLAVFGIALSSFSLKQMLANSNKSPTMPLRKF